ncbi:IclR family transcriptional regulator [Amycolatopsis sp. CA-230715]|uniref:IclR family transcriptional regulator n=1 Tax=Amycolatopsis sp. CA-230715 TaxID=2745196 RepID=UPI001C029438|nr:IclR family transcriptional regulator C-terminal domain-containing protein [Amycolatopsis sp. CA-230715]QWF82391.1 HTH-type transcriptional regulator KipR [Amycolatopsis sp. CA-230715]
MTSAAHSATSQPRRTAGASSSRKVLQLLLSFTERRAESSVAELATIIGTPVATTYRYVALLKELQLLEEGRAGRYRVTSQVMPLARAAQQANDLTRLARPAMEEAARKLRESIMLFQQFGDTAVCAELVESDPGVRPVFTAGHSMPLGKGASGKMLLAILPEYERERIVSSIALRLGPGYRDEIQRAALNRYALSADETTEGVWACSVPVPYSGNRPSALTVAAPSARLTDEAKRIAVTTLQVTAARVHSAVSSYS